MIMTDVGVDVCSGTSHDVANIDDDDDVGVDVCSGTSRASDIANIDDND